jgi:hypothetical protein
VLGFDELDIVFGDERVVFFTILSCGPSGSGSVLPYHDLFTASRTQQTENNLDATNL